MSYERNRKLNLWAGLLIAVLLCSGCIKVTATTPADGATGVARDAVIQVTFSANAKASTVNTGTFLVQDSLGNAVSGTVTYASKVATFTPASALVLMRGYTVTLTTGIKDTLGSSLKANYTFDFTTSDGAWGKASLIETNNAGRAILPRIAVDADGNAVAVWQQYDGTRNNIWSNFYTPSTAWITPELIELDAGNAMLPQIATDPGGHAVAVWEQSDGTRYNIWANHYTPGSGAGTIQRINTISAGDAVCPQIAIDADGNAIAIWMQSDGTRNNICSNHYTTLGGWDVAQAIETDNAGGAYYPQIAVDANGNAVAVWMQSDGTRSNIWTNRYTPGSGWGTAQLIESDNAGTANFPEIAVDADGNAVAVWSQSDGTRFNIWANRYTPDSGWGTAQLIESDNAGNAMEPFIAIAADGVAMAIWQQSDGTRDNIWANRYTPSDGWGTAQVIETYSGIARTPQIAVDAAGNAVAVWSQSDDTRYNIWANRYTPGSGWGTAQLIETDNAGDAEVPQVAFGANGHAVAVWMQSDDTRYNIWSNRFE